MTAIPVPDFAENQPAIAVDAPKFKGKSALYNVPRQHELHGHVRQMYDDLKHLGYFDLYGTSCFAMAALAAQLLRAQGYATEVKGCHAIFSNASGDFYLGYQGYARPGQVEGHVVCVVNGNIVLDFGLGNVKSHYQGNFYRAIACAASNYGPVLATLEFDNGVSAQWRTDWVGPGIEAELQKQEPALQIILAKLESYRKNRIAYLVKHLFSNTQSKGLLI
ncbi:MAG: hypothetical protein V4488_15755 [Pseudomonadota bacterium]